MEKIIEITITFSYMSEKLKNFIKEKKLPENELTDEKIFILYDSIFLTTLNELPIDLFKEFVNLDRNNSFEGLFSSDDENDLGGKIIYTAGSDEIEILNYEESERAEALLQKKDFFGTYKLVHSIPENAAPVELTPDKLVVLDTLDDEPDGADEDDGILETSKVVGNYMKLANWMSSLIGSKKNLPNLNTEGFFDAANSNGRKELVEDIIKVLFPEDKED